MNIFEFDAWAKELLFIDKFVSVDDSLNGLQVACSGKEIKKIAFAVDACAETISRAIDAKADVLFVHHGLFWGKPLAIKGGIKKRLELLFAADMAVYACHLPLDAHPELGNNAVLARMLGLTDIEPFGMYHGISIGFKGKCGKAMELSDVTAKILPDGELPRTVLPFGKKLVSNIALVSGGAPFEVLQAIEQGLDLYITGEPSHSVYHTVLEAGINFIAAGHYHTEVHGVKAVAEKVSSELGITASFIECPTGL